MYAYCDVDEPTVLRVRRAINEGRIKPYASGRIPILMGLQGEEGFPRKGYIDFVNNQVNPTTGSILIRGVFDNPLPPGGRRLVDARHVRADPTADRATASGPAGHRSRHSVGPGFEVRLRARRPEQGPSRRVNVGPAGKRRTASHPAEFPANNWSANEGLRPDDLVVVGALQQVRPNQDVQPEPVPMPALEGHAVTGTVLAALSAQGADADLGESSLTYTWSATRLPEGAAPPAFSVNDNNAAKHTAATLSKAGTYDFTVTIADSGHLSVTSSVSLAVPQTLKTIMVSPATAGVNPGATQQFTATGYDQFGAELATQPKFAWTTTVGTINEKGLFTAQRSPGSGKVTAGAPAGTRTLGPGAGLIEGTSSVSVTSQPPTVAQPASAVLKAP